MSNWPTNPFYIRPEKKIYSQKENEAKLEIRKDTINVEKQDLETWYVMLQNDFYVALDEEHPALMDEIDEIRDAIYRYLH